jgi:hypothetical protein
MFEMLKWRSDPRRTSLDALRSLAPILDRKLFEQWKREIERGERELTPTSFGGYCTRLYPERSAGT